MIIDLAGPERFKVSRGYIQTHEEPSKYAKDIPAVWMIRDPGTHPAEPLRIMLDQSVIQHMGWRAGDSITAISSGPESGQSGGKLTIRKARRGELAFILDETGPISAYPDCITTMGLELCGPGFSRPFPAPWVETYFPGHYDEDEHYFSSQTECAWNLIHILKQSEQIELPLQARKLFLYLQRTKPTTLDLHLVPGLLHLKNWSRAIDQVLESKSGFDPLASDDVLTIREGGVGEEPNLIRSIDEFTIEVNPGWLNRFFPDIYESSATDGSIWPAEAFASDQEESVPCVYRDTYVVEIDDITSTSDSLSFEITLPPVRGLD